jgi:carboxypeptidase Q
MTSAADHDDESRLIDSQQQDDVPSNKSKNRPPWYARRLFFCVGGFFACTCIMASIIVPVILLLVDSQQFDPAIQTCSADAARLIQSATADATSDALNLLTNVTDVFGPRLTGSVNLENAIDWIVAEMTKQGLQNVKKEPVTVLNWMRGNESLVMSAPFYKSMAILGLGGTCNTTDAGIEAVVLVVSSQAELKALSGVAAGKIVLFNVPFTTYGATVQYRVNAWKWASQVK